MVTPVWHQAWIFQNDRQNRHQRFLFKPITDVIIAGLKAFNVKSHIKVGRATICTSGLLWNKPSTSRAHVLTLDSFIVVDRKSHV